MAEPIAKQTGGMDLADIMNLITAGGNNFAGGKTTTTKKEGQKFDQEQMNIMLQNVLEQAQGGYADVGGDTHAVGGYNSTTQALALNDLLTRSAQQVALLNTDQVTTQTSVTDPKIGKEGITDVLGLLAGGQAVASGAGALGDLLGIGVSAGEGNLLAKGGSYIADLLGFGTPALETAALDLGGTAAGAAEAANAFVPYNLSEGLTGSFEGVSAAGTADTAVAAGGGFWDTAYDTALGNNTVGQGLGYATAAYNAYNDIKDDNWGGAAGSAVGAYFGGPIGAAAGQVLGTALDEYILDPLNDKVLQPVGHAFDKAITQNVGEGIENIGKGVKKVGKKIAHGLKKVFCFAGDTEIVMADGTSKLIQDIKLGDATALGGRVLSVGQAYVDQLISYKGTWCTESHIVLEDEVWIEAGESIHAGPALTRADQIVYPITTENHALISSAGFISSDFLSVDSPEGMNTTEVLAYLNDDETRTYSLLEQLDDLFAESVQE